MNNLTILDCTLRDGGYINDWQFGEGNAKDIIRLLEKTGVNIIELGFLSTTEEMPGQIKYNSIEGFEKLMFPRKEHIQYSVMIDANEQIPIEKIKEKSEHGPDIIRITMWKRLLEPWWEYCYELKAKGYEIGIQPTRVEQYSDDDFKRLIELYNPLKPKAIYIVDTFGLLRKEELVKKAEIADRYLDSGIALGYHAHNNMQQAIGNAEIFVELNLNREIMVDVSCFGMGRGAGNLCSEIFLNYLNTVHSKNYKISPVYEIFDKYLNEIFKVNPWGYSLPYFITAKNGANPVYASQLRDKEAFSTTSMGKIFDKLDKEEGIVFSKEKCEEFLWKMKNV